MANGSPSPNRRNSWFSNISSKFSSSSPNGQIAQQPDNALPKQAALTVPKANPAKNAVLQHATKYEGEGPYTPAPPKSGQPSFLGVFRRLSSSGGVLGPAIKGNNHGLVERRVLNVDQHRERCRIADLNQAKLRRVAFCVDVEIAPMPRYVEGGAAVPKKVSADKTQKRKMTEKGEGEALKNPKTAEEQKEEDGTIKTSGEQSLKELEKEGVDVPSTPIEDRREALANGEDKDKDSSKKKEKKKKSEEERKARKEKKRKLAEANGTIPMEIHMDSSDSSETNSPTGTGTPKTTAYPTTNPVRIYRRCCQLRETPILKKITEQLTNPTNVLSETGVVEKLDLTGYWLQLPDLVTLGDYLAIVPVRELVLENCGLSDESLRVVLAGLLAARMADVKRRKPPTQPDGLTSQGGVIERLFLKNNKIGPDGWKHLCLFIYLCRSLKCLDLSQVPFPRPPQRSANGDQASSEFVPPLDIAQLFSKSLGGRLAGPVLELLNIGEIDPTSEQLGTIIDGAIQCGLRRLGLARNHLDEDGVAHVARFLADGKCEGLDLGGNDLREQMGTIANNIKENDPLWALSFADCNLKPGSLCKIFPKLVKLKEFRFIDFSHNQDLFKSEPSSISILRRHVVSPFLLVSIC
jgi:hypothetical protein